MKKKYLIYLLAALMVLSPAAVFADINEEAVPAEPAAAEMEDVAVPEESAEETAGEALEVSEEAPALMAGEESLEAGDSTEWTSGWNEKKTQYKNDAGEIQTGLFKGRKKNGSDEYALFHADSAGNVEKRVGVVTVTGLEKGKYYSFNGRAFDYDPDLEGTVKYFQKYDSTFDSYCMDETAGLKDSAEGRYYLNSNGTIRTEAGMFDLPEGKFYVKAGGAFWTDPGWLNFAAQFTSSLRMTERLQMMPVSSITKARHGAAMAEVWSILMATLL